MWPTRLRQITNFEPRRLALVAVIAGGVAVMGKEMLPGQIHSSDFR